MNIALTETRAPIRRAVPVSPGSSAVLVATAAAADGGPAALQPWEGETLLARLAGQFAEPRHRARPRAHAARVGRSGPRRRRRRAGARRRGPCRRPARDRRHRRRGGRAAGRRLRRHRHPARGARGPAGRAEDPHRRAHHRRQRRPPLRLQDALEPRPHRLGGLALPRRAPPDRDVPRRAQGRAGRPPRRRPRRRAAGGAGRARARPPTGRRSSTTRPATGTACWRCAPGRERGEPAPEREALDAAALSPEDAAELERRRAIAPDDVTSLLLVGVIRSGVHVSASRLRSLFWARPGSPAGARARRARRSSSTTRIASCSTRRSRARTASSPRSSSRPTRSTSPAGRRAGG